MAVRKQRILEVLQQLAPAGAPGGITAEEVAQAAGVQRHNASADLNQLCREGLAKKSSGRPVYFRAASEKAAPAVEGAPVSEVIGGFDALVGARGSLRAVVEQAQAAVLYPPRGLATLIVGPTGAGKSRLAEVMYAYGQRSGRFKPEAPFHVFNCADYASNPQLLLSQLFGHVKGAFTGADRDHPGLVAQSDGGVLFLDEIHRLPPEGQEMLFVLMDRGTYRALGTSAPRKASLMLIAATSEDPKSALLGTFLRRFPVVITLPDMENRPLDERLAMIELFLREEAARVGMSITVSPLALVALLSFRTAGNVGELRSAVLLGCAKAFLNHMAARDGSTAMPLYLTHLSPQIQLAYLSGGAVCREAERFVGLEDRLYSPAPASAAAVRGRDEYVPPEMYSELRRRVSGYVESGLQPWEVQQLIQTDLDYYLRRLLRRTGGAGRLSKGLLDTVGSFVRTAGTELGRRFEPEVVTGLALHLASRPGGDAQELDRVLSLVPHCPREYGVVRRLAPFLEAGLGVSLSPGEITFLALFLAAHGHTEPEHAALTVLVIAHGASTASSMAAVANRLLGEDRVLAVDMPLEQSIEQTLQLAMQQMKPQARTTGLILLVDMGSLTGFGPAIEQALGIPVAVVPSVTTAAVIEAGRLAGEPAADLVKAVAAVKAVYAPSVGEPIAPSGKRMIITTCLTGQGTARKLAAFLKEALPPSLRDQVVVQPVDLENGSPLPGLLVEGWRGAVVAATGTVDPHLPGVTFIGMEQILFGDGLQTLVALASGGPARLADEAAPDHDEAIALASRFVAESIDSVDGQAAAAAGVRTLAAVEAKLEQTSSPGQAARWVIHFGFALERLATGGPALTCSEMAYLQEHHGGLLEQVRQAVTPVAEDWGVTFVDAELGFLALILLSA
jgi:transcriptional regulator with AAA-type ATPase domain/transcriptional regulatory protein LevR